MTDLTEYAELHGCSCKVGQADLESLLREANIDTHSTTHDGLIFGIGEDAAARRLTDELALVQTIDFFTPVIDDPYDFGQVAACNAMSDAFATGATENLSCLAVLGVPRELTKKAAAILAGMADALSEVGGTLVGGHTILNPWPLAGGAITATAHPDDLLSMAGAAPGDHLFVTKPLGTQPAMGALRVHDGEFAAVVTEATTRPVAEIGSEALAWMTTPNLDAALLAREFATAATDVTGFGLLGQSRTLAARAGVGIELTRIPVIPGTPELSELFGYGLETGESAETSGGLLLSVPNAVRAAFVERAEQAGLFCFPVGRVVSGTGVTIENAIVESVQE